VCVDANAVRHLFHKKGFMNQANEREKIDNWCCIEVISHMHILLGLMVLLAAGLCARSGECRLQCTLFHIPLS
jgi:hypothetical protein